MEQKFIKFLTQNNAYRQYMHNLAYVPGNSWTWADYRDSTEEKNWLICAFIFNDTKEGHAFWYALASNWHKFLN